MTKSAIKPLYYTSREIKRLIIVIIFYNLGTELFCMMEEYSTLWSIFEKTIIFFLMIEIVY